MKDKIRFNGKTYTIKWLEISGYGECLIAEEDLEEALMPDGASYVSDEARFIDEMIFYYVPKGILRSSNSAIVMMVEKELAA